MTELQGLTHLLPITRELEASLYEKIRQLKDCQLITEGDIARQEDEWPQDEHQGRELRESVLSWQA